MLDADVPRAMRENERKVGCVTCYGKLPGRAGWVLGRGSRVSKVMEERNHVVCAGNYEELPVAGA